MPIYEYLCEKCQHEFEREQRIKDAPVKTCPKCRSRRVKRLISQTSFVLKGGGWYADGYGDKKKPAKKEGGDTSKESGGAKESAAKSDSSAGSDAKTSDGAAKKKAKPSGQAAA